MSIKVQVHGDVLDLADDLQDDFVKTAKSAMRDAARVLQRNVKAQVRKRVGPDPAPEGEPPARQEGDLERSIKTLPVRARGRVVSSGIYTDDPGAARLEWGKVDKRGVRTFPHPYLQPAADASEEEITRILNEAIP